MIFYKRLKRILKERGYYPIYISTFQTIELGSRKFSYCGPFAEIVINQAVDVLDDRSVI